ncbi:hypothetical protein [Candidatus Spongiihabitans sp.]|uniref:hypothetical protein n=1 Tax=Candidatus Spongiihabitans sp. TaxID=3101308 RepID=UPI003C7C3463
MPGPYYYWPGNLVIKPFGVAELLISAAKSPTLCPTASDSLFNWIPACRRG